MRRRHNDGQRNSATAKDKRSGYPAHWLHWLGDSGRGAAMGAEYKIFLRCVGNHIHMDSPYDMVWVLEK